MAPIADFVAPGGVERTHIHWLPAKRGFTYDADPFGVWRDGRLHVFFEHFDYGAPRGRIMHHALDANFAPGPVTEVLNEPFHLSYPFTFEHDGEVWMLPEMSESGRLTLYRATEFPLRWEATATLMDAPVVDPTVFHHDGFWWMFHTLAGPDDAATMALHVAFAERLTGPWRRHPMNPVIVGRARARPAGGVIMIDGVPHLPTQDCRERYGGAINLNRLDALSPDCFAATQLRQLTPGDWSAPYLDGFHTISAAGDVTLVDVKRFRLSYWRHIHDLASRARRWASGD